jgi:hypothetical protein
LLLKCIGAINKKNQKNKKMVKNLINEESLRRIIKDSHRVYGIKNNPYIRNGNAFSVLKRRMQKSNFSSFFYFLFKEVIKKDKWDEKEYNRIAETDIEDTIIDYILKEHKKAYVDKNGRLIYEKNKGFLSFLKSLNKRFYEGEKFYLIYEYNGFLKKGTLKFIKRGNKIIWGNLPETEEEPKNNKKGTVIQLKLQFPE